MSFDTKYKLTAKFEDRDKAICARHELETRHPCEVEESSGWTKIEAIFDSKSMAECARIEMEEEAGAVDTDVEIVPGYQDSRDMAADAEFQRQREERRGS